MPTIHSTSNDGWQQSGIIGGWDNVHDATGAGNPDINDLNRAAAIGYFYSSGRGTYQIVRSFLDFDTSGITSTLSEATLKVRCAFSYSDNSSVIAVKSGHDPSTPTDDWFSTWLTGLSGTLSGWGPTDSEVVDYSTHVDAQMGVGYFDLPLNSDALSDIKNNNSFKVVLMEYDHDYLDVTGADGFFFTGINFQENGTGKGPKIDYELATGYGGDIIGVASANIQGVSGVTTANVEKVIGV